MGIVHELNLWYCIARQDRNKSQCADHQSHFRHVCHMFSERACSCPQGPWQSYLAFSNPADLFETASTAATAAVCFVHRLVHLRSPLNSLEWQGMGNCHLSLIDEAVHTRGKVSSRVVWIVEENLRCKSIFLPAHHSSRTGHLEPGLHLLVHRPGEWHAIDGLRPRCPEWSLRGFQEKFRPPQLCISLSYILTFNVIYSLEQWFSAFPVLRPLI